MAQLVGSLARLTPFQTLAVTSLEAVKQGPGRMLRISPDKSGVTLKRRDPTLVGFPLNHHGVPLTSVPRASQNGWVQNERAFGHMALSTS